MLKLFPRLPLLLSLLYFFAGCDSQKQVPPEVDPAFIGYISGFTSGMVSNSATIRMKLMDEAAGAVAGAPVEEELFDFDPGIDGQAYWLDTRTIEFRPEERLPSGKLYDGEFYLHKLMDVPEQLEVFPFQFQVMQQAMQVEYQGLQAYNNQQLEWQQVLGTLQTADVADDAAVEEALEATQLGEALRISWHHEGDGRTHHFTVDSVSRTEEPGEVLLRWQGDPLDIEDEGSQTIEVPALGDFKVVNVTVTHQPEQYAALHFSDPLDERQDLNGLVWLSAGTDIRTDIRDNELRIYPSERQKEVVTINVEPSVRNVLGYTLQEGFSTSVQFKSMAPAVQLLSEGAIMPRSERLVLPFQAVNLQAVNVRIIKIFEKNIPQFLQENQLNGTEEINRVGRVVLQKEVPLKPQQAVDLGTWNTFSLDLSKLINTDPGAIYLVELSFTQEQSLFPCTEKEDDELDEPMPQWEQNWDEPQDRWSFNSMWQWDYYRENYNWRERDNPCNISYYLNPEHRVAQNILASNLGIIAKGGNSEQMLFAVTDLRTTEPLQGVELQVYNYQQQPMQQVTTNSEGMAEVALDSRPFLLIAKKGNDYGYLRLDDGSAQSLSMFEVDGNETVKGMKGYIYGERGVWRPGDSLYLSFILEDMEEALPENHPVTFELYDPRGRHFEREVRTASTGGIYDFRTATPPDAPTGNWLARVRVGGSTFTKSLRIETVKPNRLKIELDFEDDYLSSDESNEGDLEVRWLHGAKAPNLKADVQVHLTEGKTTFERLPGYIFDDPTRSFRSEEQTVFEGELDAEGTATVRPELNVQEAAPGMLQAHFKVRAFENGGEFSVNRFNMPYSPYRSYVGLKLDRGTDWMEPLYVDQPVLLPIATIHESGQPHSRSGVKVEVYKIDWSWWWETDGQGDLGRYVSNNSHNLIHSAEVTTGTDGKAMYEMKLEDRQWGRHLIRITDPLSGHSAGKVVYFSYPGWWNKQDGQDPKAASMLSFSTDKEVYEVGEEVSLSVPSGGIGRILVSIESGSKVLDKFWVEAEEQSTGIRFSTKEEMAPTAYVHLTYIQPHSQTGNDLPIRMYGVRPIKVEDPNSHLQPQIRMAKELKPEEPVAIAVSEASERPMSYTLAVVDEGLLDLTNFQTPEPWDHFYAREALGVSTWDLYDQVIGAFTGKMAGMMAVGGDENLKKPEGSKVNRFEPVVKFLGPFQLREGETRHHNFRMPNYIGSVRVMVVAVHEDAYGSAEKTVPVKKPLMVLSTLPRVLGPQEQVKLPVTVFAMDKKVQNVTLQVQTNDMLQVKGSTSRTLTFSEPGEQLVMFDLNVPNRLGVGTVKVTATGGGETATHEIKLNVRVPNPEVTRVVDAAIGPGESWDHTFEAVGMPGTNEGVLEVSRFLPINLHERLEYLIRYPHGCVEQTVSGAFPQIFVKNLIQLEEKQQQEIERNVSAGISRLRGYQNSYGGFSYWPGQLSANDWSTSYAGHFLLEAKAAGYAVPAGMLDQWKSFQRKAARSWKTSMLDDGRAYLQHAQAYRLYTLALANEPELGAMNRMGEWGELSTSATWSLAAAYQLAGKPEVAQELARRAGMDVRNYQSDPWTYGSSLRDQAMILEALTLMGRKTEAKAVMDEIAAELGSGNWYSTQTTAYSLLAVSKFVGAEDPNQPMNFSYTLNGSDKRASTTQPLLQVPVKVKESGNSVHITNTGESTLFVKLQLSGIPAIGDSASSEQNLRMAVRYLDLQGNEIDPGRLNQGTDFVAEVQVQHPGVRSRYNELALTQIFPSGWEIRNIRLDGLEHLKGSSEVEYQDIRDDRVMTYFDLNQGEKKTFRVMLNASYLGRYYLPATYCQAMYDNTISARFGGRWVEVAVPGNL